ncbi:MAG: hypothetical protein ABI647_24630, partial [Gemmatimonadota bacterium]
STVRGMRNYLLHRSLGFLETGGAACEHEGMDYQAYVDVMQNVSNLVDAQRYDEALAEVRTLLASDLPDRDKAILCVNMAVIHDKMAKPSAALDWYDRGREYDRTHRSHMVVEYKAEYLVARSDALRAPRAGLVPAASRRRR